MKGGFTRREQQVIDGLFEAMCNKEIAAQIGCEPRTIKMHIRSIAQKLDIDQERFLPRVRIVYLLSLLRRPQG